MQNKKYFYIFFQLNADIQLNDEIKIHERPTNYLSGKRDNFKNSDSKLISIGET